MSLGARRRRPPTPRFVANELWRRAGEVPSFHIAPARTQNARDLITGSVIGSYNSASPAWAVGPDGVLFQPAANAPVIEYDPVTLACLGARIWGVVTNQIRNNTMVGAVAGTPGTAPTNWIVPATENGISRQIVGTGQSGNIDYVDVRYSGTTTAAGSTTIRPELTTVVIAATGQTWTASSYVLVVAGSTSGITSFRQRVAGRTSGGSQLEAASTTITTAASLATARFSASMTFANASTARATNDIVLSYNSDAAIDITLRIGLPQLEQSATMGPVVKTTTTAASSTADVWSITGADFSRIWNQAAGTVFIDWNLPDVSSTRDNQMLFLADAAGLPAVAVRMGFSAGFRRLRYYAQTAAGVFTYTIDGAANSSATGKTAFAFSSLNDSAASENGASVVTDTVGDFSNQTTSQIILGGTGSVFANGYIRELAIFRSRRPNANLQAMTP